MSDASQYDAFVRKLLRKRDRAEALGWLDGAKPPTYRNLGELPAAESRALVRGLYAMGAKEVFVVDIGRNGIYESTAKLLVRLPTDAANRTELVSWADEQRAKLGFDAEGDRGQEYLFVGLA